MFDKFLSLAPTLMSTIGMASKAYGMYADAKSKKLELNMQAANHEFELGMKGLESEFDAGNLDFQAQLFEQDAQYLEKEKQWHFFVGEREAFKHGMEVAQKRGKARAMAAARGVDVAEGSVLEEQAGMKFESKMNSILINIDTLRKIEAVSDEQINLKTRAGLTRLKARSLRSNAKYYSRSGASGSNYYRSSASNINPWMQALGGISSKISNLALKT